MRTTEYLIIGAGAAGSTMGYLLRKAGKDVLTLEMLDARTKNKLCAGLLEPPAERAFFNVFGMTMDEAGLDPQPIVKLHLLCGERELVKPLPNMAADPKAAAPASQLEEKQNNFGEIIRSYLLRGGKAAARKILRHALGYGDHDVASYRALPRKRLDDYLLTRYQENGGQVLDRTTICSLDVKAHVATCIDLRTKEKFTVSYKTLIGADGAASVVRRMLTGKMQNHSLILEASVPLIREETVVEFASGAKGYSWYAPRGEDATLGCGYHELGKKDSGVCRQRLQDFAERLGLKEIKHLRGALLPKGNDVLLQPGEDVYLLGDAAGLADPFTGGGIHYAMVSAQLLTNALLGGEPYEEAMAPYVRNLGKHYGNLGIYFRTACQFISRLGKKVS